MKRNLVLKTVGALLTIALSFSLGSCSGKKTEAVKPAAAVASTDPLKNKWASLAGTTLKVGTSCVQQGWSMDDGKGNPEGMDADVMKYICDYYGIKLEWTVSEYASLWGMVQNGVIDTIANLTTVNKDRLGLYWFTNTYAWESYSIVSRKADGIPADGDMAFWNNKTISGEAGSNATFVMEDMIKDQAGKGINIKELVLDSATVLIPSVVQSRADAAFMCTSTCAYAVAQSGNSDLCHIQNVQYRNMPIVYGWARKDSNKDYILAINDLIKQMHEDGTLKEFSKKWFNMDVVSLPAGEVNYVTTTGNNAWQSYTAQ